MKKIVITMDRGVIEARYDDGDVLRGGDDTAFLGKLAIDMQAHSNYMPADQIAAFLDSVVLPQLNLFSRQIENEVIEEEEAMLPNPTGDPT